MIRTILKPKLSKYNSIPNNLLAYDTIYIPCFFLSGLSLLYTTETEKGSWLFSLAILIGLFCFISGLIFLGIRLNQTKKRKILLKVYRYLEQTHKVDLEELVRLQTTPKNKISDVFLSVNNFISNIVSLKQKLKEGSDIENCTPTKLIEKLEILNQIRSNYFLLFSNYKFENQLHILSSNICFTLYQKLKSEYFAFNNEFYDLAEKLINTTSTKEKFLGKIKEMKKVYYSLEYDWVLEEQDMKIIFEIGLYDSDYKGINECLENKISLSFYEKLEALLDQPFDPISIIILFKKYPFFDDKLGVISEEKINEFNNESYRSKHEIGINTRENYLAELRKIKEIKLEYSPQYWDGSFIKDIYHSIANNAEEVFRTKFQEEINEFLESKSKNVIIDEDYKQKLLDLENENQMLKKKLQNYEDIDNERLQLKIEVSELKSQLETYEGQGVPYN